MRNLALDHTAELAILPREGLQLVPPRDGQTVLSAVAAHIAPGGRIFVDLARFSNGDGLPDPDYYKPGQPNGAPSPDRTRNLPDGTRLRRNSTQMDDGDSIAFDQNYNLESEPPREWSARMRIYRYSCDWIKASAPEATLLEEVYGGYDRSPLKPGSNRTLAVFRKLPVLAKGSAS